MSSQSESHAELFTTAHRSEFARVEECIDLGAQGRGRFFLLDFFAPDGFGKTALLDHIWRQYEAELAISLVRVAKFVAHDTWNVRDLLIKTDQDLSDRLTKRVLRDIYLPSQDADEMEWAARVVALAKAASSVRQVSVLLFDDFDLLPDSERRWLESHLLGPLAAVPLVGVILTTQKEVRFDRIDLRSCLQSFALSGLTVHDVESRFPQYGAIAPQLQVMTGGLPALTSMLVRDLESSNVRSSDEFVQLRQELMQKYYSSHVLDHVLSKAPGELQDTVQVLALLRRIDVPTLRSILPQALPDIYRNYDRLQYVDLIEDLGSWVQWRSLGGYEVNPAFASILRGYVLMEKPRMYRGVHQTTLNYYLLLLDGEYREYYLVESLYHRLMLLQFENHRDHAMLQEEVSGSLRAYLDRFAGGTGGVDLDSLRNTLEHDPELKAYVAPTTLEYIQTLLTRNLVDPALENSSDAKVRSIRPKRSSA